MARRKRRSRVRLLIVVALLALVAVAAWTKRDSLSSWAGHTLAGKAETINISAESRPQRISDELKGTGPARDGQLGVSANGAVLFRHVEMYQWQEHCEAGSCRYDKAWSAAIDSNKFREPKGHENRQAPFNDSMFVAPGLKVGEYAVDPDLLVAQLHAVEHPVHDANLPPNLAATFSERDGVLYAGGDPAHPALGEVRISYRVIASGSVVLNGVVRGNKLVAH
jgi:cell division protein YceG involved in septum cleavage